MGQEVSLSRLKWFAIVAPVTFLAVVGFLVRGPFHEELHEFPGYLYVLAALAAGVALFSFFVFGVIARVEQHVLEQNAHLSALLAVGQAASSSLQLVDVLDAALDEILSVSSAEAAEIWLAADDHELVLARQRGSAIEPFAEPARLRFGQGLPGVAAEQGSTLVVHDLPSDSRCVRQQLKELGFKSFCAQPLVRRRETVGVLAVASRSSASLASEAEHRLLEAIGEQLVIAIENAQLHERVLDGAVLEERERLARELHDGLAQVLGYVNTQTLAIQKLLASGRAGEVNATIEGMRDAAKDAYTDVRAAILGLRSTRDALLPSLRSYLAGYQRMTGTSLKFDVDAEAERLQLPPSVEIQLVRIVQEALTNVRKHADATTATVSLAVRDGALELEVVDDGRGFELDQPSRTGWPRFGLQTMRERAQAIGGTFEFASQLGVGTRIAVGVPLETHSEVAHASAAR